MLTFPYKICENESSPSMVLKHAFGVHFQTPKNAPNPNFERGRGFSKLRSVSKPTDTPVLLKRVCCPTFLVILRIFLRASRRNLLDFTMKSGGACLCEILLSFRGKTGWFFILKSAIFPLKKKCGRFFPFEKIAKNRCLGVFPLASFFPWRDGTLLFPLARR